MTTLRERLNALADEDLARLVMVTAQALNDQEWTAEIAKPCGMSQEQLEAWAERVVWKADPNATLFEAATKVLGWASPAPVMIDIAPLLPMLDTARRIRDELAESEARFQALSRSEQLAQVGGILDADRPLEKTYDGAVKALVDALLEQTAHGYTIMQVQEPIADESQPVAQERDDAYFRTLENTGSPMTLEFNPSTVQSLKLNLLEASRAEPSHIAQLLDLLEQFAGTKFSAEKKASIFTVILQLPEDANIRDLYEAIKAQEAASLGVTLEQYETCSPLIEALQRMLAPSSYEAHFKTGSQYEN